MKTEHLIKIKTQDEIKILMEAGQILASVIQELQSSLKSGMTTQAIDDMAAELIAQRKVTPAFKGYRGFPGCVCCSINEEVVHGVPSDRVIQDGDIVSIDVGIIHNGYYADTAVSVGIGKISPKLNKLLDVTATSLMKGIEQALAGNRLSDISHAVQEYVEANHMSVVRDFVGHGIGKSLHEDPEIPNFGPPNCGPVLEVGMVLAVEPMVNLGVWKTKILDDGWTVVTEDGQPSAHFEHSIAITEKGPLVLTQ